MANSLYDKNYAKAVSNVFYEKMLAEGRSLENVADATKTKYNTLFRYMNGSRQIPLDLFKQICEYLNLDFVDTFQLVNQIATETTIKEYDLVYGIKDVLEDN